MAAHDYHDREDGLKHCKACGGAEGSLPTACPRVRMSPEQEEAVYAGTLDYNRGRWWKPLADVSTVRTFEEVWAEKEAAGFRYGRDALEQVRFGFELARGER